jgi:hypothetical protein
MISIDALRSLALSFPEALEAPHFEHVSFRVKKKIFASYTKCIYSLVHNLPKGFFIISMKKKYGLVLAMAYIFEADIVKKTREIGLNYVYFWYYNPKNQQACLKLSEMDQAVFSSIDKNKSHLED